MTAFCPYCNSEISEDNPALALEAIKTWVSENGGWGIFETQNDRWGYPVGKKFVINGNPAEVVANKVTYDKGDLDTDYYGGELPQGTTFDVFVVIKYGDNKFFKKTGTGDSYGEVTWDGELRPVTAQVRTIEVYEYNG